MGTRYWSEIVAASGQFGLDPLLVEAIVIQESGGNTDAFRFEPNFWNRYLKKLPQWVGSNPRRVSASYGLMQLMYPVALERGYGADQAPELLFVPEMGLWWGCKHLAYLSEWASGYAHASPGDRLLATIAAYNGGRGGNTPDAPLRPDSRAYATAVLKTQVLLTSERGSTTPA